MKSNKLSLYLDESGKSSLLDAKDPFIITGTIINDDEIKAIEGFFTYIKRKFKIDENKPFHSYHTFEEPNTKLSDNTLQELAVSLSEFISLIPIKIRILSVDKTKFRDVLGVKSDDDFKGDKKRKEMSDYPYHGLQKNSLHLVRLGKLLLILGEVVITNFSKLLTSARKVMCLIKTKRLQKILMKKLLQYVLLRRISYLEGLK